MDSTQFGADLAELSIVGRIDLRVLNSTFASMNTVVSTTAAGEEAAFRAPAGGTAASFGAWTGLRNELQNMLGRTAMNMLDAAAAIDNIVEAYAATDRDAEIALRACWDLGQVPGLQEAERNYAGNPTPIVSLKDDN